MNPVPPVTRTRTPPPFLYADPLPWLTEPPSPFGISGGAASAIHCGPGRISLHRSGDPVHEKRAAELDRLQGLEACLAENPYDAPIRLTITEENLRLTGVTAS